MKSDKTELSVSNNNYKEKLELFETHLNALKDEIKNSQTNYKKMLNEKDSQIENDKNEIL